MAACASSKWDGSRSQVFGLHKQHPWRVPRPPPIRARCVAIVAAVEPRRRFTSDVEFDRKEPRARIRGSGRRAAYRSRGRAACEVRIVDRHDAEL